MSYDCFKLGVQIFFRDLDVGVCTSSILFESTQNKQLYLHRGKKKVMMIRNVIGEQSEPSVVGI